MLPTHTDPGVLDAICALQTSCRRLQGGTVSPEALEEHCDLLIALEDALVATGVYDDEAARCETMTIAGHLFAQAQPWRSWLPRWLRRLVYCTGLLLLVVGCDGASAQPLQLVDCTEVNLLGTACEESAVDAETVSVAPAVPEEPLFTLQTMRPDTPPLLVNVFNDPSEANIAAYKDWQQRYLSRALEVEHKLKAWDQQHAAPGAQGGR